MGGLLTFEYWGGGLTNFELGGGVSSFWQFLSLLILNFIPKGNVQKHSRGVQLISLDLINSVWITKTEVSKAQAGTGLFFSEKNLYCAGGRTDGR